MARKENRTLRRRLAFSWISTVICISLVLLLVGVAALLLVNARSVSNYFKENLKLSVILVQDASEDQAVRLQSGIDAITGVRTTEFISREQGIGEMARLLGEDFLDVFETAPVPISIDVSLDAAYVEADSIAVIRRKIEASPLVDEVVYQKSLVDKLNQNLRKISVVIAVLIALLLFISFVLIANTVRLNVFARRFSIHTMKLVGATRGFIRGPFMWQSAIQGLFASLLAICMIIGALYFLRNSFSVLFQMFSLRMLLPVMAIVVVAGEVICLVSTWITVGRAVGMSKDEIYS
ncbi:MAG: permease-like cell division protein FtsX [Bacteroidales bacterium]|nr:permease-like cell division protein FtsX [Bacteroidales bacterium]